MSLIHEQTVMTLVKRLQSGRYWIKLLGANLRALILLKLPVAPRDGAMKMATMLKNRIMIQKLSEESALPCPKGLRRILLNLRFGNYRKEHKITPEHYWKEARQIENG